MLYRINQFIKAIFGKVYNEDIEFLKIYLNNEEFEIFRKLSISEQRHCLNVAYGINKDVSIKIENKEVLILAALLHDIGKVYNKVNLIEKSIIVILNKVFGNSLEKFTQYKAINIYYNHGDMGYNLIKEILLKDKSKAKKDYDKVLFLIRNHHNEKVIDDKELNILKYYDNMN